MKRFFGAVQRASSSSSTGYTLPSAGGYGFASVPGISQQKTGSTFAQQTRNTTILCVRKENKVVMVGDGLVTQGNYKVKPNALKVRTIGKDKNLVIVGFAGVTADCLALLERLEMKLEEYPGQLVRASVELAKSWRMDKMMRQLNSTVIVANAEATLELTGTGDCFEPHDGILGIGSGGPFASAAARALLESKVDFDAKEIAVRACTIAANMDTASNSNFIIEEIDCEAQDQNAESKENSPKPAILPPVKGSSLQQPA